MWVDSVPHELDTVGILRGMMISMELDLARLAPHDVVLVDGSFSSLVIYLNQGLQNLSSCGAQLADEFLQRWRAGLMDHLLDLLRSDRTVAIPKFTSRNELLTSIGSGLAFEADGKTLATFILNPGEYTRPLSILAPSESYHLLQSTTISDHRVELVEKATVAALNAVMQDLRVVYYRPYGWLPAIRLELPGSIASSSTKLSRALDGVLRQFFSPAVMEPYPLFLADRMVKSLGSGVAVIEQAVAQQVVADATDIETTMLCLQNYRTEGGRGGT
ncbi:MAG: DNA double-strand break repair nuclease NurA [Terriglobales bacterium]